MFVCTTKDILYALKAEKQKCYYDKEKKIKFYTLMGKEIKKVKKRGVKP